MCSDFRDRFALFRKGVAMVHHVNICLLFVYIYWKTNWCGISWSCYFSFQTWGRLATPGDTIPKWWCFSISLFVHWLANGRNLTRHHVRHFCLFNAPILFEDNMPQGCGFVANENKLLHLNSSCLRLEVCFFPDNKVEFLILQFMCQNNGNTTMKVDALYILVGKGVILGWGLTYNHYIPLQNTRTTNMQDKVMTCIEQFSQHMCLVHFTRAYITHVCKDCITASQGSLWINQQHVASQGLWTHI